MVAVLFVLLFMLMVFVMGTLGAVLLARFVLGAANPSRRVLAAALAGPLLLLAPVLVLVIAEDGADDFAQWIGFGVLLLLGCGCVGWPVAHFATRRLDRLSGFDPQIFE